MGKHESRATGTFIEAIKTYIGATETYKRATKRDTGVTQREFGQAYRDIAFGHLDRNLYPVYEALPGSRGTCVVGCRCFALLWRYLIRRFIVSFSRLRAFEIGAEIILNFLGP